MQPSDLDLERSSPMAALERHAGDYVVSLEESAKILNVCGRTVLRMLDDRTLAGVRVGRRRRGIMASELARHIEASAC